MSEHQDKPISGETGSVSTGPTVPSPLGTPSEPVMVQATAAVESPQIALDQEETPSQADASPKVEAAKVGTPTLEAPKAEAPNVEIPKVEATKPEAPRLPGKLMIMSPGDRVWSGDSAAATAQAEEATQKSGKRRVATMAAVVALATVAGALGGALATAGYGHLAATNDSASAKNTALEASVARIDADILALKASVEHTVKMGMGQFNKTSDRLDKVEKALAEPSAKLAKLSEAVDKLRSAPAAAAPAAVTTAPVAARDVTGTVTPPATATAAPGQAAPARPEVGKLPTIEGWVLRDVFNGSALIEGHRGMYEVYAGDPIPGLGRVDAIRRQDGRWVVVTSKGLIVAR